MNGKTLQLQDHQDIIESRIESALQLAIKSEKEIILSHSFRIDASDLLPILTHPADRHSTRIYLEKPSSGFSMAGMGCTLAIDLKNASCFISFHVMHVHCSFDYCTGNDKTFVARTEIITVFTTHCYMFIFSHSGLLKIANHITKRT